MTKQSLLLKPKKKIDPLVVAGVIFAAIVIGFLFTLASAFVTMILFDLLNAHVAASIPAFGYWQSVLITYSVSWLGFVFKGVDVSTKS